MVISTPQSDDAALEVVCVDHTDDMEVDRHFDRARRTHHIAVQDD